MKYSNSVAILVGQLDRLKNLPSTSGGDKITMSDGYKIDYGNLAIVLVVFMLIGITIAFILWKPQQKKIGTIVCKRCGHMGLPKGLFVIFRGIKPVCQECHSEDWVKHAMN